VFVVDIGVKLPNDVTFNHANADYMIIFNINILREEMLYSLFVIAPNVYDCMELVFKLACFTCYFFLSVPF